MRPLHYKIYVNIHGNKNEFLSLCIATITTENEYNKYFISN